MSSTFNYLGIRCNDGLDKLLQLRLGTWGGLSSSAIVGSLRPDSISSEMAAFAISNGAQFLYSLLYLLLNYNITIVAMEHEWGGLETKKKKPRSTIVSGPQFEQSYFLQLPSKIIFPMMAFSAVMHWLLGSAISTTEQIFADPINRIETSKYFVSYAAFPIFVFTFLMIVMTSVCWWAFSYKREGFMPQMYGSIRVCCASTTNLTSFNTDGISWGDLGMGEKFRHSGFTSSDPDKIVPGKLYS
ncbi:hypothetical protein PVAG01_04735 [Phlyctema vagabunda]|uniref:Uncharacterized protein n=1 Tax=Phlyctema vagabunda TaxID=108571 RepID=A0ABR4PI41_9HELO